MNVIVSNKQKKVIDSANIDAIKDLNGLFDIDELINNFKGYFFSKMIIDATSIIDFAKESVLRKLANEIGAEKIYLLLPPKPEPPKRFCDFLTSLGIYNYSTKIEDIVRFLRTPNTNSDFYQQNTFNTENAISKDEGVKDINNDKKIVLGFKNVTSHAGSTSLIYMIKTCLEKKFKLTVDCIEVMKNDFRYFSSNEMVSVDYNTLLMAINNCKNRIVLVDLNDYDSNMCDEVIYLIEPSTIKVNELLYNNRDIFTMLSNKKVVLNKSMLNEDETKIFGKEAGIDIYFSIPYVNDRIDNVIIEQFINKIGILDNNHGLFNLFK